MPHRPEPSSTPDPLAPVRNWHRLRADEADAVVVLDGFHALKHALRFGAHVPVALTEDAGSVLDLADALAPDLTAPLRTLLDEVPPGTLGSLVPRAHPTGVAALAARAGAPAVPRSGVRTAPLVVLDDPRNLGNVGAVVRLAAGCGAAGVLTTGGTDPWHPAAVRAGAGLHFATAVARAEPDALPEGPLYALDPEGDDLRGLDLPDGVLLAFGTERHGLSPALRERADRLVSLPMEPLVSSYNLATSVAMALYHWMSRRP
ncbi:TrmH family RNA methyltransferase [Streptomyces xiaopingdaonensis]|uniref:TrmH family RNA methyltransferase n=1 Tax=Streptomyces xiaopingdaonensis TaxID=1565415 RepID=UPI0002EA6327|nr:RNA methyltransferase [Streptomyces xiaopingdaonensis]